MLVLTRKVGERILIGDDIVLTILDSRGDGIRVGIDAPRGIKVQREEVVRAVTEANVEAAAADPGAEARIRDLLAGGGGGGAGAAASGAGAGGAGAGAGAAPADAASGAAVAGAPAGADADAAAPAGAAGAAPAADASAEEPASPASAPAPRPKSPPSQA